MSKLPETGPSLRRYLRQQQRQAGRQINSSAFTRSGSGVTGEDELTIDGALIVTGHMAVGGTLSLPAGIIDNDALSSPVVPVRFNDRTSGWALAATAEVKASETLTTPAGFTRALVSVVATAGIANSHTGRVVFTVQPVVNGVGEEASYDTIESGFVGKDSAPVSSLVTGLTGGATFTVQASVFTGVAITASGTNMAAVNGVVIWLR